MVSKEQIVTGIVDFMKNEVLSQITDRSFRSIMSIITGIIEAKPNIIENILNNSIVISVLDKDENDMYDIDTIIDIIENNIVSNGPFVLTIPGIKFISPDEKELSFSADDFEKLKRYINNARVEAKA